MCTIEKRFESKFCFKDFFPQTFIGVFLFFYAKLDVYICRNMRELGVDDHRQ